MYSETVSRDDSNLHPASLDDELGQLVDREAWQSVVRLGQFYGRCERSRYLWAWPSMRGLNALGRLLWRNDCHRVLSIGCGAGLLEWMLMQQCPSELILMCSVCHKRWTKWNYVRADMRVFGLDLDESWWTSAYAPAMRDLVPRTFVSPNAAVTSTLLRTAAASESCADGDVDGFALLFCYFNDRSAFDAYVNAFGGRIVVVIGPLADDDIVTDPRPLDLLQDTNGSAIAVRNGWRLGGSVGLDDEGVNVAVLYVKD